MTKLAGMKLMGGTEAAAGIEVVADIETAGVEMAAEQTIRVADIISDSIVDGPGFRLVVFAQGCNRNCPKCHNPNTHARDGGYTVTCEEVLTRAKKNPLLQGLTFSGGEPFLQAGAFSCLAKAVAECGFDVVTYTGYTYEQLILGADNENKWLELLSNTDILIDGPYDDSQRTLGLPYRGSRNQRAIDAKASIARNEIVTYDSLT